MTSSALSVMLLMIHVKSSLPPNNFHTEYQVQEPHTNSDSFLQFGLDFGPQCSLWHGCAPEVLWAATQSLFLTAMVLRSILKQIL